MIDLAADGALALLALAAAAWVLLLDVLCIGSCTDTPRAGAMTWLVIGGALGGAALLFSGKRRAGRVVLTVTIALAIAATLAG